MHRFLFAESHAFSDGIDAGGSTSQEGEASECSDHVAVAGMGRACDDDTESQHLQSSTGPMVYISLISRAGFFMYFRDQIRIGGTSCT